MRADSLSSTGGINQLSTSNSRGVFPQEYIYIEAPSVFCFKWNGPRDALTWKKAGFPCRGLNAGSSFIYQDERMSESPLEILQKALCLHLIWRRGLTSLWHLERHAEFSASKADDAWLFLYIVRNPRITVPTEKWPSVSCHTSRTVRIVLPSQFRFITRQESWRRWKYMSFEWPSHRNSRIYPKLPPQFKKNHETYPSARDEARFCCIASRAIPCSQSNK